MLRAHASILRPCRRVHLRPGTARRRHAYCTPKRENLCHRTMSRRLMTVSSTSSTQRGTCTVSPSHGRHRAWHLPIAYPPRISLKSTTSSGNSSISAKRSKCKQQRPGCADPSGSICTRGARWLGHNRTSSPPYRPKIRAAGAAPGAAPPHKGKRDGRE